MSTHPNVILMAVLTPDDLSRKTMRMIKEKYQVKEVYIKIGEEDYYYIIMESEYEEGHQISAKEGDLIFFNLVTYGYGDTILWDKIEAQKKELEKWAKETCREFHCSYEIRISANYW